MDNQNHELLGLIVAQQRDICEKLLEKEKKKDERLALQHAAFMETCIPHVWESAANIMVPHYSKEICTLQIPVQKYGRYIRRQDRAVGLRMYSAENYESSWRCVLLKTGKISYNACWVEIDGKFTSDHRDITKQQFEQTFLTHIARVIPVAALAHIAPAEQQNKKTSRRVVALAKA